jgi:hypothetical protein
MRMTSDPQLIGLGKGKPTNWTESYIDRAVAHS